LKTKKSVLNRLNTRLSTLKSVILCGFVGKISRLSVRTSLVAGNWKLNGSRASAVALAKDIASGAEALGSEVLICPGFAHLGDVQTAIAGASVALGAQNCSAEDTGAFTGEVSASMIAEFGSQYVIVGHSERRALFGESSSLVADKALAVQQANMQPIVCIGETLEQREAGQLQAVLDEQLDALIDKLGIAAIAQSVIAYEPVWAIGTGKSASSEQAQEVHSMIRKKLAALDEAIAEKVRILYGGSVKPDNAAELFSQTDIDGGLIGGAALNAESFLAICQATDS